MIAREFFVSPRFFQQPDGRWVEIDTSLSEVGSEFVPAALPEGGTRVATSASADADVVTVGDALRQIRIGYPDVVGTVPGTVEDASLVRFASAVAEGADLAVRVTARGWKDSLVVADDGVSRYRVRLGLPVGALAREDGRGGVEVVDATGKLLLTYGDGSLAYDSADVPSEVPVSVSLVSQVATTATVQVEVDRGWLSDPARAFPVTIDPYGTYEYTMWGSPECSVYILPSQPCDVYVNSDWLDGKFWQQTQLRVGSPGGYTDKEYPGQLNRTRTFLKFATDNFGSEPYTYKVHKAEVRLYAFAANDTTSSPHTYRLRDLLTSPYKDTAWNNQPSWGTSNTYKSDLTRGGVSSSANGDQYFWDITNLADAWFRGVKTNHGVGIRLGDTDAAEQDIWAFKKFYSNEYAGSSAITQPRMFVEYYDDPSMPTSASVVGQNASISASWGATQNNGGDTSMTYKLRLYTSGGTQVGSEKSVSGSTTSYSFTGLTNGQSYYFKVRASNVSGTSNWRQSPSATPDGTNPVITSVSASPHASESGWYTSRNPCFDWAASDPETGITGYSYQGLDHSSSTTPDMTPDSGKPKCYSNVTEGTWYFHVRARNGRTNAQMWGDPGKRKINIDYTAPATPSVGSYTHSDESSAYLADDVQMWWSANDLAPINGYSWVLDQSSSTEPDATSEGTATAKTFYDLANGTWWFHVKARNASGLWSTTKDFQININADAPTTPGISSSTHPDVDAWYANPRPSFTWSSTATNDIGGYSWELNQSSSTTPDKVSEGTATAYTVPVGQELDDGIWWLHVRAVTDAGLWGGPSHYRVQIDTSKPGKPYVYAYSHPSQSGWHSSNHPDVYMAGSDPESGIDGYSYVLNQSSTTTPDTISEGSSNYHTFDDQDYADGTWWLHVITRNRAGLWSDPTHYQINIDTTPPARPTITSSTHPNSGGYYEADDVRFVVASSDQTSSVTLYRYSVASTAYGSPSTSWTSASNGSFNDLDPGNYWILAQAADAAGNVSETGYFGVHIIPHCAGSGTAKVLQPDSVGAGNGSYVVIGTVPSGTSRVVAYRDADGDGTYSAADIVAGDAVLAASETQYEMNVALVRDAYNCIFVVAISSSGPAGAPTAAPVIWGGDTSSGGSSQAGTLSVTTRSPSTGNPAPLLFGTLGGTPIFGSDAVGDLARHWYVTVPEGTEDAFALAFQALPIIENAYVVPEGATLRVPNDSLYSTAGDDDQVTRMASWIGLEAAWDITTGSTAHPVAVLDTGIRSNGEDKPDGTPRLFRIHADLDAKQDGTEIDCVNNFDATTGRCNTDAGTPEYRDPDGHGTNVAGIIGAITNNGDAGTSNSASIAGVGWDTRIRSYRVLGGGPARFAEGVRQAADDGYEIINLSAGFVRFSDDTFASSTQAAINYAERQGSVFVAAAGNCATSTRGWPAANYGAVSVGAVDADLDAQGNPQRMVAEGAEPCTEAVHGVAVAKGSAYGKKWLSLAAPGERIPVLGYDDDGNDIAHLATGTSVAAPQVSGALALLIDHLDIKPLRALHRLYTTATDLPGLELGHGLINIGDALGTNVIRLSGFDRVATAAEISREVFPGDPLYLPTSTSPGKREIDNPDDFGLPSAVVLVAGFESSGSGAWPDALTASALAGATNAQILLGPRPDDPDEARAWDKGDYWTPQEMTRLIDCPSELDRPGTQLYVVGGEASVPPSLLAMNGCVDGHYQRISGSSRYGTAAAVARLIVDQTSSTFDVLVATGEKFPDAVGVGGYAYGTSTPVLLTRASLVGGQLEPDLEAFLSDYSGRIATVRILGGTASVGADVEARIAELVPSATRVRYAGSDRYETARLAAEGLVSSPSKVVVAAGEQPWDALTASSLGALRAGGVPVLLTPKGALGASVKTYLAAHPEVSEIYIAGGTASVSHAAYLELRGLRP